MAKKNNVYHIPQFQATLGLLTLNERINKLEDVHKQTCEMAARTILKALDMKDHYTFGHSMRVAFYSLLMGREIYLNENDLYKLELAALFHDIGKIGIPDSILLKPERLNEDEFQMMKTHPEKSAEILDGFEDFEDVAKVAKHHHERFDGRGYPNGLKGKDIPMGSRIILIADTFDAMTSSRPYRKGLTYQTAFEELREFGGSQFDADLVEAFIHAMTEELASGNQTFFLKIMGEAFEKNAA
ncbi:MAG: HD-GYP domain-containing protein [Bacteriovoracaceae bacterium]|nr:HD-GYP domain-containing protein [Bacteriovoracaceae bacterium]